MVGLLGPRELDGARDENAVSGFIPPSENSGLRDGVGAVSGCGWSSVCELDDGAEDPASGVGGRVPGRLEGRLLLALLDCVGGSAIGVEFNADAASALIVAGKKSASSGRDRP